jgi:hypothetical protein
MAAGITARQYTNNAVFTEKTKMMMVPLNGVPGTGDDLVAMGVAEMGGSLPSAILLSNPTAATIFVRVGNAGMTGMGVAISSMGSMFFPIAGVPTDGIYVETTANCFAICFE